MKKTILLFILVGFNLFCYSQNRKYEFRGAWVSTVANIDWPSSSGLSSDLQKMEIETQLNLLKEIGCNAIILQVRPTSDAIYPSELEPWSRYLMGKQGLAPTPYYDPLAYWIEQTHKRGMELHAWFNPYRIQQNIKDTLAQSHIINKHPDWGWVYGTRRYFEPGNPDVWKFISQVVVDVVKRYDIDAVHFDDYFYPYAIADQPFPDSQAFEKFGGACFPNQLDDWRRHNVDTIIQILSSEIKETKPWVKFGISPFGVWRNRAEDSIGSETKAGTTNYDALYADIIKWQRNGWIDYTLPQLYWHEGHPAANFSTLAYWWSDFSYGRSMYLGLAPYRIDKKSDEKMWKKPKYFYKQLELLRSVEGIDGFCFFSSAQFKRKELSGLHKKLKNNLCKTPAIVPPMPWIDKVAPLPPTNLNSNDQSIAWDAPYANSEMDKARFYAVYYYPKKSSYLLKDKNFLISITGENKMMFDKKVPAGVYRISSLDRLNNESQLSQPLIIND